MLLSIRSATVLSSAAAALAAAAIAASPAAAAPAAAVGAPCPSVAAAQPFTAWQDVADYVLAPDGGAEAGAAGWSLTGGASVAEGNESFSVGGAGDHRSIVLPARSSATTAPICVGAADRTMRFFLDGPATGQLAVQAVYTTSGGREAVLPLDTVGATGRWAPSPVVRMRVDQLAADGGVQVALRFTPRGADAVSIDDVYVDPYRVR